MVRGKREEKDLYLSESLTYALESLVYFRV
jgi:hypothetical protein